MRFISAATMLNVRSLLRRVYEISPRRYEVYAMSDGDIAIDGSGSNGRRVVIVCESGGGILRLVSPSSLSLTEEYPSADAVPDDFLREALDVL